MPDTNPSSTDSIPTDIEAPIRHQLEVKRVETLFGQTSSAIAANLLTGTVFSIALGAAGHPVFAVSWLTLMAVALAGRYLAYQAFRTANRGALNPTAWFRRYGIGIAATGCLWGASGVYAMQTSSLTLTFFAVTVLTGMVGGSVATCAVSPAIFLAFTIPTLLPPSLLLLLKAAPEMKMIGILVLVYGAIVTRAVIQIKGVIVQSLFHRYENKRLLGELQQEKQQIQESEQELRKAYETLEETHQALKEQRNLVDQERIVSARLREIDRVKDEFLANTSHELRTPLYGIVGLAETLIDEADETLSKDVRNSLAMIVASGQRLSHLVGDILDFSKLRHANLTLERRAIDLQPLIEVVLTLSRPLVGSKDVELAHITSSLPAVDADEARLQQILHNLIGNAIKFTEKGRIEVSAAHEGDRIVTTIADTGIGIPKEAQVRIFDAFVQADAAIDRQFGGTGLGLAITRQLVELHGGELWMESEEGVGSTFRFSLPISTAETVPVTRDYPLQIVRPDPQLEAETLEHPSAQTPDQQTPDQQGRAEILVVDDEPVNRRVLQAYLRSEGFRVTLAPSGAEALRRIRDQRFDLVLLDIMMPQLSGHAVCQMLRETYSISELPILFLTAKTQESDIVTGLGLGANDYLTKPISKDRLLARIRPHLSLLHIHRDLEGMVEERVSQIKVLEGLLPICADCKKIRDDAGTWMPMEDFIGTRSEASFSHGICPDCFKEHYPDLKGYPGKDPSSRRP